MSVVGSKLRFGLASSLLLGGCLLSFYAGRWSAEGGEASETARLMRLEGRGLDSGSPLSVVPVPAPAGKASAVAPELGNMESTDRNFARRLALLKGELGRLAERDPARALALADGERFEVDRRELRLAALQGWAKSDPAAALAAALEWDEAEAAVKAVLSGAAVDPQAATELYARLRAEGALSKPELQRTQLALVVALADEGNFEQALAMARSEGEARRRQELLTAGFSRWSRFEPEFAVVAAMDIEDRTERQEAYSVVTATWSEVDPAGLAQFAEKLPQGEPRALAMSRALQQWVGRSPQEAAQWLESRGPAQELDVGVLALATHPYLAERSPQVAVSWAESLWDENLRADTVALVVKQWAATDRKAAIRYVREHAGLGLPERQELLALFGESKEFGIDGPLP
ncbi:hypothetical protein [Pelagicoccus sp. SDUM812005]|uniref:hypothetical protein n=1 Tax=Pelagicoccus sp. SDUM812005 TaxID=3041257 RepID=UPI00281082B5|nr:hypothetical protein [Pelagicoccus sp. SDUM812005]MDQ8179028.1 hypothetical protein [Pelagicoccus sp. SDUM812005]